jgi:hypothetical protein
VDAMGNVIPWSQIDPSIKSEQPFVGVIMVDPQGKLCVSDLVHFDPEAMDNADQVASEIIAAAQQAAARVAISYRAQRKPPPVQSFRVLKGGAL